MSVALSPRQRQLVDAIVSLTARNGYPPTIRELRDAIGAKHQYTVMCVLRVCQRKGAVAWDPKKTRTLRVVGAPKSLAYISGARDALRMLDAPDDVVQRVFAQLGIS